MRLKIILVTLLILLSFPTVAFADSPGIILDGQTLSFEPRPRIEYGRIMVPLRVLGETLGCQFGYADGIITISKENTKVNLKIGNKSYTISNGSNAALVANLDVPARIENGRTLVPLRFIAETMDCNVAWDAAAQTAALTRKTSVDKPQNIEYSTRQKYLWCFSLNNILYPELELAVFRSEFKPEEKQQARDIMKSSWKVTDTQDLLDALGKKQSSELMSNMDRITLLQYGYIAGYISQSKAGEDIYKSAKAIQALYKTRAEFAQAYYSDVKKLYPARASAAEIAIKDLLSSTDGSWGLPWKITL